MPLDIRLLSGVRTPVRATVKNILNAGASTSGHSNACPTFNLSDMVDGWHMRYAMRKFPGGVDYNSDVVMSLKLEVRFSAFHFCEWLKVVRPFARAARNPCFAERSPRLLCSKTAIDVE